MNNQRKLVVFFIMTLFFTGIYSPGVYSAEAPLLVDTEASCITADCHAGMGQKKYAHGVGVAGKHCKICHKVVKPGEHSFQLPPKAIELCIQCHSGRYIAPSDIEGTPPVVITTADVFEEGAGSTLHKPFAEGKCTECHDPHESNYYAHLKESYPEGFYSIFALEEYGLCLKCHKDFERVLTEPRTVTVTKFRNGNLNLHFRHVNKTKGRTCRACHHPHGSEAQKLIKDNFIFGKKKLMIDFEKTDTGGSCGTSCHTPSKYDRYDPVEILMKTTPRIGKDATEEELRESRERDLKAEKEKEKMPDAVQGQVNEKETNGTATDNQNE